MGSHIKTQIRGKAVCAAICVLFLGCWRSEQSDSWVKAEYCAVGLYIEVCRGTGNTVLQNNVFEKTGVESRNPMGNHQQVKLLLACLCL